MIPNLCAAKLRSIKKHLETLYGGDAASQCLERLVAAVGRYGVGLDGRKPAEAYAPADIVLIAYADILQKPGEPPLQTLGKFVGERLRGAVNTMHLLPFFPWSSDDGFSVTDHRKVHEAYGKWEHVAETGKDFNLMFDLVINHVSSHGSWFQDYKKGIAPGRFYFIEADPANAALAQVMRPRTSPLLTQVRTKFGERHVWTTFSSDQIDLNFTNPDVLFEMLDIMLLYISKGARILRLDAVAYLWKEIGSNCIHRPQTHVIVKLLRDFMDMTAPATRLLTETNVPHAENISYFGDADEAHMIYQFSLPPLLLHAIHNQDTAVLTGWAASLEAPPPGCAYLNFTASHDGIGVRPLQGLVTDDELRKLAARIERRGGHVSLKRNADGSESPYEFNISYMDAVSSGKGSNPQSNRRRFLLSQAVMLAMQGVPAVYFHSLFGTRNDAAAVKRTGMPRRINRRKFGLDELKTLLEDRDGETRRVFDDYRRMLEIRGAQPAFAPHVPQQVLDVHPACFALQRQSAKPPQTIISISNFSSRALKLKPAGDLSCLNTSQTWFDLLADTPWKTNPEGLSMDAWQTRWLSSAK